MLRSGALHRGSKLVIASHNEGKLYEFGALLVPFGIDCISAGSLGLPEPEETGGTFEANAFLKARGAAEASGIMALGDDSGIEIEALDNKPGIHSARWGGPTRDFRLAMDRLHTELEASGSPCRRANFISVLALVAPDKQEAVFTGKVFGEITWPPRGENGFGYDPIFVPEGHNETFGEMDPDFKNDMSHRMRAFEQLIDATYANDA